MVYSDDCQALEEGAQRLVNSLTITKTEPEKPSLIYGIITENNEFVKDSRSNDNIVL